MSRQLIDLEKTYSRKEVLELLEICRATLAHYCSQLKIPPRTKKITEDQFQLLAELREHTRNGGTIYSFNKSVVHTQAA
jgi:hypothetical protein